MLSLNALVLFSSPFIVSILEWLFTGGVDNTRESLKKTNKGGQE
jgi:hypothetical protein